VESVAREERQVNQTHCRGEERQTTTQHYPNWTDLLACFAVFLHISLSVDRLQCGAEFVDL
jgi:hypothetical protein